MSNKAQAHTFKKKPTVLQFTVSIVVEADEDGYYAYCPALKGLHTCGATEREAVENAKNAATAYIRSLIKHGDPIPVGVMVRGTVEETTPHAARKYPHHHIEQVTVAAA